MKARKLPKTPKEWVKEILLALEDAREAVPFAPLVGAVLTEDNLFHLAPHVAFKFRGLVPSAREQKRVVESALANHILLTDRKSPNHVPELLGNPRLTFALSYVAAHGALGLLTEEEGDAVMSYCDEHLGR